MSLVAYAASSDEESDNEEESAGTQVELLKPTSKTNENKVNLKTEATNGHISDEDDDYIPREVSLQELKPSSGRLTLSLPKPKVAATPMSVEDEEEAVEQADDQVTQAFAKLPMPRQVATARAFIEEVDDEFLHKKAGSEALEKPPPPPAAVKTKVKISIPSLREFADVDKEQAEKQQQGRQAQVKPVKGSGLLSMLPQAKSERVFTKRSDPVPVKSADVSLPAASGPKVTAKPAFVPDTVKLRRAAHNTEGIDRINVQPGKQTEKKRQATATLVSVSDSEEDEDEDSAGDFFSLNSEQQLPEVSSNEINALVAKRAAKMVEASNKFLAEQSERAAAEAEAAEQQTEELRQAQKRYQEQQLNAEAMDALVGKNAKRRRKEAKEMQVIDISGTQVMPDRDEWMRTALASATTFQPTGVLTDEEHAPGTRRKHQITYLAHKAKANEAELQAMWSANRQTRRDTQNKYGF
ncbi:uncharacterized protein LOC117788424 [Drosophila innubila]|uniref:uncharacterized protein LOC117788424 n=1 Tax=Drosophila innubila TaxID=198719 RepID=UPI00148BC812|nr:uncharacterized protein LOC117788424 [Drosophila innubila]